MARGRDRGGTPVAATRISTRQCLPPPVEEAGAEPGMRGGGRGQGRSCRGARGQGGRGGVLIAPPPVALGPNEGHVGDQPLEFIVKLRAPHAVAFGFRLHSRG